MSVLVAILAALVGAQSTLAVTRLDTRLPPASLEIKRSSQHGGAGMARRGLLQTSSPYPNNSAPPGSVTGTGLRIYTPVNCSFLDADDFAQFFYDSYMDNSVPGVYLSAGNYTVNSIFPWKAWVLYMNCRDNSNRPTNFEISFEGSTLSAGNRERGLIGYDQCSNLYVHGGIVTYTQSQLPFTQGTLVSVNQTNWIWLTDPGYPGDDLIADGSGHLCVLYDSAGRLIQNGTDPYLGPFLPLGNKTYNIQASFKYVQQSFASTSQPFEDPLESVQDHHSPETGFYFPTAVVGVRMACRGDTEAQHVIFCSQCKNFRMSRVSVYSSNIFAVFESQCTNSIYDRLTVIPDPRGINGIPPLFSSNADGFHSSLPFSGPQITNSVLLNMGDDGIAVQGIYLVVAKVDSTTKSVIVGSWSCDNPSCLSVNVGDSLLMYSAKFLNLGSATIQSVTTTTNPRTIRGPSPNAPAFNYDTAFYFRLRFTNLPTSWVRNGGPDSFVTVALHNGNGANIVNNTLGNNRARGIYHRGLNGEITNNRVLLPSAVGILMSPDLSFLEADFNQNILVKNNFVNATGTGIFVSSINATQQATQNPGHNNITITGNSIYNSYHPVIIGSAQRVTMSNNTIFNGGCYPNNFGDILDRQSTVPKALVYISFTTLSTFSGNTFATNRTECRTYGNYTSPYQRGPGASVTITG